MGVRIVWALGVLGFLVWPAGWVQAEPEPPLETELHHIYEEPGGVKAGYAVPAQLSFPKSHPQEARVEYSVRTEEGFEPREGWVLRYDLAQAAAMLKHDWVWVEVPTGGMVAAVPQKRNVMSVNGHLTVGLSVEYEDHLPSKELERRVGVVSAVIPLASVSLPTKTDPLAEPLIDQQYLLGSADPSLPSVPVLVLGGRKTDDGVLAYLVAEWRDILDPDIRLTRLYLVPITRLRKAVDGEQYLAATKAMSDPAKLSDYIRFRQEVLSPWLHRFIDLTKPNEDPVFENYDDRFERRLVNVLTQLGNDPDDEDRSGTVRVPKTCADYLYLP